jgi:hypothetical protein
MAPDVLCMEEYVLWIGMFVPLDGRNRSGHFRPLTMRNHEDNRTLQYDIGRFNDNIYM